MRKIKNISQGTKITPTMLQNEGKYLLDGTGTNWWTISEIQTFDATAFYQPVSVTDPFGGITQLTYDSHKLLIESVTDADNRTTTVENNYRLLQAWKMTDPNGNSQCVDFDTLGMVKAMAVMGKNGEGDTLASPTIIYQYDLHNWKNNTKPVYSHIKTRETHGDPDTRWMESYTYTSGLGQEVQTKVQAEDGLAWILPASGIPKQIETTDRWVATGRTILNNKGKAVKQYEPWFSTTPDYEPETELTEYGVTPILHYDPLTRNIKTDFPDGTFTKVEFSPWEQKTYDQNDNVLASQWYTLRSPSSTASDEDKRAAQITIPHNNTPQTQYFDSMGRVFIIEDDNGTIDKYRVHNTLDIGGRPTLVIDAKGREMTRHFYAYKQPLYTQNIDSGKRWMVGDVAGKPIRAWNERGHSFRNTYDILQRPLEMFVTENNTEKMVQKQEYGNSASLNNIGQVENVYSQDGKTNFFEYDFKNNLLTLKKLFAIDYQNVLDWNETVPLQSEELEFVELTTYDAMNRPITITQPDTTVASYVYNKGGLLEQVLHGATEYISNINYNEKGQRSKISYGNNTQTLYTYNPMNFRLTNIYTKRNSDSNALQDLNFTFDAVGNIVEQTDNAQQTYYYSNQVIAPNAKYTYDPLYRLINATGRELASLVAPSHNDFTSIIGIPAANAMQTYNHTYEFDELGNMQSDNWKDYVYDTDTNRLLKHDEQQTVNDYTYDVHGNMLTMPHLTSMVWDFADRLQSAGNGTFTSYYNYDLEGNRSRKVVVKSNIREERYYFGDYEIYRKYVNDTKTLERSTVHIIDDRDRFAMIETETGNTPVVRYQYNNHLGSACLELDTTAQIISYEEYHPYGTTSYRSGRTETEVSLKRYKYVGKERDEETGLYYYGARYYAAWLCRFVSVDPLQFEYPHYTPYQYAGNKPISYIDLDGLEEAKKDQTTVHKPDALYVAPRPSIPAEPLDPSVLKTPKGAVSFTITYEYKFDIPNNPFSRISISITGFKVSDYKFDPKGQPGYTINIKVPTLPSGSSRVVNYNNYTYKGANLFGLYNQENWKSPDPTLAQVFFSGLTEGFYIGLATSVTTPKGKISKSSSEVTKSGTNVPRSSLTPTHYITKSRTQMKVLLDDIRINGIKEPVKYVELNGEKFIVDGHHRFYSAQKLGIQNLPAKQVYLPYSGYKNASYLMMESGKNPGFWQYLK